MDKLSPKTQPHMLQHTWLGFLHLYKEGPALTESLAKLKKKL